MRIMIVGAGGHGQVVADILLRLKELDQPFDPVGFLDDDEVLGQSQILGLEVYGKVAHRSSIPHDALIVAIGDNRTRRRLYQMLSDQGADFAAAYHPKAIIAPDVKMGQGTMICAGVIVNTGVQVGSNVILNTGCSVDHHCKIEDHAHIAPGARMGGSVIIGEGALVGIGAIVLPGRSVGAWSQVSAGAVVNHDIPEGVTAAGAPARIIRKQLRSADN
jgi:sugar O-acyltransferase (sialic acid O-acetyltransferase NeuD family)